MNEAHHHKRSLGIREGFYDIAQTIAGLFGIAPLPRGLSLC